MGDFQSATRLLPRQDEKDALIGTGGRPSRTNLFVTDDDSRLLYLGSIMKGSILANDGDVIAHGFSATPSAVLVSGSVPGEIVTRDTIGATTFIVRIKTNQGESGTSQVIGFVALVSTSHLYHGTVTASDGDLIPHGCPSIPLAVLVSWSVPGEIVTRDTIGATSFKIHIKTNQGEPGTTQPVSFLAVT